MALKDDDDLLRPHNAVDLGIFNSLEEAMKFLLEIGGGVVRIKRSELRVADIVKIPQGIKLVIEDDPEEVEPRESD